MRSAGIVSLVFMLVFAPFRANAGDTAPAWGGMVLGAGLVSGVMELRRDNASFRVTGGMFHIETCVSASLIRYAGAGRFRPYAGVGIWSVSLVPGLATGRLLFATMPVGVRWQIGEGRHIGIEVDLHYFLTGFDPDGDRVNFDKDHYFLALPGIYYLRTL